MFTFGIFTTHIPYVALVVFYAYFLIFGVDKAAKGEVQASGKTFTSEIQVAEHINIQDQNCCYYYSVSDFTDHSDLIAFLFKRKIKHRANILTCFCPFEFITSLSNRPPPFNG